MRGFKSAVSHIICFTFFSSWLPVPALADSVTLVSTKDNTLYESTTGALSNGVGAFLFSGKTNQLSGSLRRALFEFNIADSIPAGSTIDSVSLTLHMSKFPFGGGSHTHELHRALASWGEGTSDDIGNEGSGATATPGDATWLHRVFDTDFWGTAGGDFSPTISASQTVGETIAFYSWSSTQMTADVQDWLDNPASNFGWVLTGNEFTAKSSKRFDSRENLNAAFRPALLVEFSTATAVTQAQGIPSALRLHPSYPNPFNPTTTITYSNSQAAFVVLTIHDLRGARLRTLVDKAMPAGRHSVIWDGSNHAGRKVPSGVYAVRLTSGNGRLSHKIVVLK